MAKVCAGVCRKGRYFAWNAKSHGGAQPRPEVVYGLTRLAPERASAAHLLTFTREPWHCENKSPWVRDVTFDEDRSPVRQGALPEVLAALRNTVLGLLRAAGYANIAQALRYFAAHPDEALALIGLPARE